LCIFIECQKLKIGLFITGKGKTGKKKRGMYSTCRIIFFLNLYISFFIKETLIFYWYPQVRSKSWYPSIRTPIARDFFLGYTWQLSGNLNTSEPLILRSFIQKGQVLQPLDRRNGHRDLIKESIYFQNKICPIWKRLKFFREIISKILIIKIYKLNFTF